MSSSLNSTDDLAADLESITATLRANAPAVSSTTPTDSISTPTTIIDSTTSTPTTSSVESTTSTPSTTSTTPTSTTSTPTSASTTSTLTITSSSATPETIFSTSVVTVTPTNSEGSPTVVTQTITQAVSTTSASVEVTQTTTTAALLNGGSSNNNSGGSGGLSTAGVTAVAVVVPVVVVALLVVAGIFFWRRRKQKKAAEEMRRKEVEDYGYNPNNDPTLPAVASESGQAMSEDHSSGYRGWGAATASNRKMSTTLSGGHTQGQLSDAGSNQHYGTGSPNGGYSDGHSADAMLANRRETMTSDDLGELGAAPVAGAALAAQPGMKRGPSNASSTYSAANVSEASDGPATSNHNYEAYQPNNGYGYSQHGPYGDGTYGGSPPENGGMPIVRDVSARRNTRIQQPGNYQQGNSGISQNF